MPTTTPSELAMVLKGANPRDVIEYLEEDVNLQIALWYWFMAEEGNAKAREQLEVILSQM